MMKFLKKNKGLFISLIISLVIIISIFAMKKIYPIGKYVMNIDTLSSTYVPAYYRIWDILHGVGNAFYNWNINTSDLAYILAHGGLSPTTWLIALFPKSMIIKGISFLVIIKTLIITLTTYISIDKLFKKANDIYKIMFTILYTFSNTLFLSLSNIAVLDMMALIPLLVLGYYKLVKEDKKILYVIVLSLTLMISYSNYFMLLILIIGSTILGSIFIIEEEKIKYILKVLLYTLISYGIASIVLLPVLHLYYKSYFFELTFLFDKFDIEKFGTRFIYLSPCILSMVLVVKQLFVKKDKNINRFILSMVIFLGLGIVLEPVSLIWHNDIYLNTFFEYSYVVVFLLIVGALYYLVNNYKNKNKKDSMNMVCSLIIMGMYLFFVHLLKGSLTSASVVLGVTKRPQFYAYLFIFVISIFVVILLLKNHKKYVPILMVVFSLIQIYMFGNLIIRNSMFQSSVQTTENVSKNFKLKNDGYNLVDLTGSMSNSYPYIIDVSALQMDNLNATVNDIDFKSLLKYGGRYYIISSYGGNIFSNALIHNKYYISPKEMDSDLYTLIDNKSGKYYYESKYNLDLIVPYSGKSYNADFGSIVEDNNAIYKNLFNRDDEIFNNVDVKDDGDNFIVDIETNNMYYFSLVPELYSNVSIDFTSLGVNAQSIYSTDSSIMFIFDTLENKTLTINKEANGLTNIEAGYINKDDFINFMESFEHKDIKVVNSKDKREYIYNTDKDEHVLLPIRYNDDIVVKLNGKEVDVNRTVFNLMGIYVNKGENKIEISYRLKYAKVGVVISIISIIGFIILLVVDKKKKDL